MSTRDNNLEGTGRRRPSPPCRVLLEVATKELFAKNAFRITGLPVDATAREISRQADKLKMMHELGQGERAHVRAFAPTILPETDDIREAIQHLKDPERRVIEEFFWFWPEEFGSSQSDAALQALARDDLAGALELWTEREDETKGGMVAAHNLAIAYHVTALDWESYAEDHDKDLDEERRDKIIGYWRGAFKRWETLVASDVFWELLVERIRQMDEAGLTTGLARRIRHTLPEALDKINAQLALEYAESENMELARLHIQFMRETHQGLDDVEKTAELILLPAKSRLSQHVERLKATADSNPREVAKAVTELLQHAKNSLCLFDLFFGEENNVRNELFDEVAETCNGVLLTYHKTTKDDKACLRLLRDSLLYANSVDLRGLIEKNISVLRGNRNFKKLEPAYALLNSIQEGPESPKLKLKRFKEEALFVLMAATSSLVPDSEESQKLFDSAAVVLRGISIEAWNSHQDKTTALSANKLALIHARGVEIRSRLQRDKLDLENAGASETRTSGGAGCLVAVAIIAVLGVVGSCDSDSTAVRSSPTSSSDGNYRVPSGVASDLRPEGQAIELERMRVERSSAEVERLGQQLDSVRRYLDSSSQYAIDQFNSKVQRYNSKLEESRRTLRQFNLRVERYNTGLQRSSR